MLLLLIQAVLVFIAAALGQALALWVALWPLRRSPPEAHWSVRARLAWCARVLNMLGPLCAAVAVASQSERFSPHPFATAVLELAAFLGGTLAVLRPASWVLRRRVTWGTIARDYIVSFLVLRPGFVVMILMAVFLAGREMGPSIAIMAGALLLAVLLQLGATLPLLRFFRLLTPAPSRVWDAVAAVAERAGMELPSVYLLRWDAANAFAFIYARAVAFTPVCVELMSDEELQSIAAHELAHLRETLGQKLTRSAGLFLLFPLFTLPVWLARYGAPAFLVVALLTLVGARLLRGFSQRMEQRADAAAHAEAQGEETYARVLEKLHEYNLVPAVMRGKAQSHPHLYDRMLATGIQPAYPRPKAPTLWLLLPALAIVVTVSLSPRLLHLRRKFHVTSEERWER
jgi:Zn-dependent protease with chaperone function